LDGKVSLKVKLFVADNIESRNIKEASIVVPTLEISIDMLRRCIYRDKGVVKHLGLLENHDRMELSNLQVGTVNDNLFSSFSSTDSLTNLGIQEKDEIWIYCIQ
jgi:hypothetical protein